MASLRTWVVVASSCLLLATACEEDGASNDTSGAGASGGGVGVGGSTSSTAGNGGSGGQGGEEPSYSGAAGVVLDDIVLYQGPSRPLVLDREIVASGPAIVGQRPALIRAFYSLASEYDGQPVDATLTIGDYQEVISTTLSGTSSEAVLASTINFSVPAGVLSSGDGVRISIEQRWSGDNVSARYPETGPGFAPPIEAGHPFRVVIVPVRYDNDGSQRLPDTSPARIEAYRQQLMRVYPVSDVEIQVHAPMPYASALVPTNTDSFKDLRDAIADLRQADNVDPRVFYYGLVAPADSLAAFCANGCGAVGVAYITQPDDNYGRAGVQLHWPDFSHVIAHELGHSHGRFHPGCNVGDEDPNYPHANATLGVYAYDIELSELHPPSDHSFMSYCKPAFVSDYGWDHFATRIAFINSAADWRSARAAALAIPGQQGSSRATPQQYLRFRLAADGSRTWLSPIALARPPGGEAIAVTVGTEADAPAVEGYITRDSHGPGGIVFIPE